MRNVKTTVVPSELQFRLARNRVSIFIDPSYTSTGIVSAYFLDNRLQKVHAEMLQPNAPPMKNYTGYYHRAELMSDSICKAIDVCFGRSALYIPAPIEPEIKILYELPFHNGMQSSGLYGLSFLLLNKLLKWKKSSPKEWQIMGIQPNVAKTFTVQRKLKDQKLRRLLAGEFVKVWEDKNDTPFPWTTEEAKNAVFDKAKNDAATSFCFFIIDVLKIYPYVIVEK